MTGRGYDRPAGCMFAARSAAVPRMRSARLARSGSSAQRANADQKMAAPTCARSAAVAAGVPRCSSAAASALVTAAELSAPAPAVRAGRDDGAALGDVPGLVREQVADLQRVRPAGPRMGRDPGRLPPRATAAAARAPGSCSEPATGTVPCCRRSTARTSRRVSPACSAIWATVTLS